MKKLTDQVSRYGYRRIGYDLILRLLFKATGKQFYNCYLLSSERVARGLRQPNSAYRYGFLKPEAVLALIRPEMTMTREFAESGFAKGNRCFCVVDGDTLAHYSWYATSPTAVVNDLCFYFPQNYVYMFNAYTDESYRGQKLYPFSVLEAVKEYVAEGAAGALTIIAANNFGSISAVERIGFSRVAGFRVSSTDGCCSFNIAASGGISLTMRKGSAKDSDCSASPISTLTGI